jgi:hypothetical protein
MTLAPNDQGHLRVSLEADDTVDHVDPGLFELLRPDDIVLFVDARIELDVRCYLFVVLARFLL